MSSSCDIASLVVFCFTIIFTTLDNLAFVWLVNSFPSSSFLFVATVSAMLLGFVLMFILLLRYIVTCVNYRRYKQHYEASWFDISIYDCKFPEKVHILIAFLDQCCTLLAVAGGAGTSGQAQVALNQSMIPLTLLFSFIFLKRYFNWGQVIGGFGIYIGAVLVGMKASDNTTTNDQISPVLSISLFAAAQIPNAMAFILREHVLDKEWGDEQDDHNEEIDFYEKSSSNVSDLNFNAYPEQTNKEEEEVITDRNGYNSYSKGKIYHIIALATTISMVRGFIAFLVGIFIILINEREYSIFSSNLHLLFNENSSWNLNSFNDIREASGLALMFSTFVYVLTKLSTLAVAGGGKGGAFKATLASSLSLPLSIFIFILIGNSSSFESIGGIIGLLLCCMGLYLYLWASSQVRLSCQFIRKDKTLRDKLISQE